MEVFEVGGMIRTFGSNAHASGRAGGGDSRSDHSKCSTGARGFAEGNDPARSAFVDSILAKLQRQSSEKPGHLEMRIAA